MKLLKFRWKVPVTNNDTHQTVTLFVPASSPELARAVAVRFAFIFLDWSDCNAHDMMEVKFAGMPLPIPVLV